ncbi:helix-turn-helix domain-containing protein [Solicola gregarius]|uniref:Helix-turn-helix domain-containing protein n=1 Tax=Solicola gregarius TaxID=2908642 RepID=A0AA46YLY1_9ACTN|nr:helix-turn-helix domain-containing protein [Solicola gregarius]UYM06074.1 helix-turn-helix domain-containing protein [Solicola gregarius]
MSASATKQRALDTAAAAEYIGVARATLKKWRATGDVRVPYIRAGSKILYLVEDLDAFLHAHRVA